MNVNILALVADAVICTDEGGRILVFNQAAEQSFGYSADEVIGQPVELLLPMGDRATKLLLDPVGLIAQALGLTFQGSSTGRTWRFDPSLSRVCPRSPE